MGGEKVTIALCQVKVALDKETAMQKAEEMIAAAKANGAELVCLPEMFHCPYSAALFLSYAESEGGPVTTRMGEWAKRFGVWLIGGSIPELVDGKLYNTCFCYNPQGLRVARHRKMHLFDVDIPGKLRFQESDSFTHGEEVTVFDTEFGRIGIGICFDMRFPLLIRNMALRGAEIVVIPAQFNHVTGPRHWDTLIQSRALDNQIFFAAVSCATDPDFSYLSYGHSAVASPDGQIIEELDEKEGILTCILDLNQVKSSRRELPTFLYEQEGLYGTL